MRGNQPCINTFLISSSVRDWLRLPSITRATSSRFGSGEAAQPSRDLLFQDIYVGQSEEFFIRACDNTVNHGVKGVTK